MDSVTNPPPYNPKPRQYRSKKPAITSYDDEDFLGPANYRYDVVNNPSHYTRYVIEPITFIMKNKLSFGVGNIIKYACRAGYKLYPGQDETQSAITDLEKVRRYAEMKINELKGETTL